MKIEKFSIKKKGELFDHADSMHDCSFTANFQNNILTLFFDHLDQYYDGPPYTSWFDGFKKLTIKYYVIDYLELKLTYGKKQLVFDNTVSHLESAELTMYKYSVDSFDTMSLEFDALLKKKLWSGTIEISPNEIEYIWE